MTAAITVRHNFETGHRLPILEGKCQSLHGHSWWVEVEVSAPGRPDTVVEFGAFKRGLRAWVDEHLDHGLMLGREDPLAAVLDDFGKVYVFGVAGDQYVADIAWPTVENVALLLGRVAHAQLHQQARSAGALITRVTVQETHVNAATWTPATWDAES